VGATGVFEKQGSELDNMGMGYSGILDIYTMYIYIIN
jgi:hypothetical protein